MALSLTPLRSRHAQEPYSTTLNTAMSIADGIIDRQRDLIGRPQAQLDGARHIHIVVSNENTLLHSRLPLPTAAPAEASKRGSFAQTSSLGTCSRRTSDPANHCSGCGLMSRTGIHSPQNVAEGV